MVPYISRISGYDESKGKLMPVKQRMSSHHASGPPPQTWSNCLAVGTSMYEQVRAVFAKIKPLIEAADGQTPPRHPGSSAFLVKQVSGGIYARAELLYTILPTYSQNAYRRPAWHVPHVACRVPLP